MTKTIPRPSNGKFRVRVGLALTLFGFFIFLLGALPGLFGLDRSTIIGLVQIAVFLLGLGLICIGGYICMSGLWNNVPKSIIADIGLRLVSTGYVIAFTAGMADVIGFGSQRSPEIPYFGPWQMTGVIVGEAVIAIGFLLLVPYRLRRRRFSGATFVPPR
jgi:hypothetical protein